MVVKNISSSSWTLLSSNSPGLFAVLSTTFLESKTMQMLLRGHLLSTEMSSKNLSKPAHDLPAPCIVVWQPWPQGTLSFGLLWWNRTLPHWQLPRMIQLLHFGLLWRHRTPPHWQPLHLPWPIQSPQLRPPLMTLPHRQLFHSPGPHQCPSPGGSWGPSVLTFLG